MFISMSKSGFSRGDVPLKYEPSLSFNSTSELMGSNSDDAGLSCGDGESDRLIAPVGSALCAAGDGPGLRCGS